MEVRISSGDYRGGYRLQGWPVKAPLRLSARRNGQSVEEARRDGRQSRYVQS
jgi:hypothetical protein